MSDEHDDNPPAPSLREATPAETELIVDLSRALGHRLLRAWEDLPDELHVLPMNRAFLSAMALAMGNFLGAAAVNDPENLAGWRVLVDQTVEIVRQTADEKRELALHPEAADVAPRRRVMVPEPKTVM